MLKKRILFVDDETHLLDCLRRTLRAQDAVWDMTFTSRARDAWEQLLGSSFDVVVSDVQMPDMNGLELLEQIHQSERTKDVQVVMLTGLRDRALKRQSLDLGATDLLHKPLDADDLVARIQSVLRLKSLQDELRANNQSLDSQVRQRTRELESSRIEIVWRLAKAAEHRDRETGNHVVRVGNYSRILAEALGLDREFVDNIFLAAPLHDIGKIGIPDAILLKPGPLTADEFTVMQGHCVIGQRILEKTVNTSLGLWAWRSDQRERSSFDSENPILSLAASIALTHHEKWDGNGYPQRLVGPAIPLESRIVAVADVFDALTSDRPYHAALSEEAALEVIRSEAGRHFDPRVAAVFASSLDAVREVRDAFRDTPDHCFMGENGCEDGSICR